MVPFLDASWAPSLEDKGITPPHFLPLPSFGLVCAGMPRFSKCLSDRHFLNIQRWRDKKPSVWLRGFVALLAAPGLGQGRPATPVVRLKPQHHLPGPALETLDSAHSQGPQVPIFTPGAGKKKKKDDETPPTPVPSSSPIPTTPPR